MVKYNDRRKIKSKLNWSLMIQKNTNRFLPLSMRRTQRETYKAKQQADGIAAAKERGVKVPHPKSLCRGSLKRFMNAINWA